MLRLPRRDAVASPPNWIATLGLRSAQGDATTQQIALVRPLRRWFPGVKCAVAFLRPASCASIDFYGLAELPETLSLRFWHLGSLAASVGVLLQSPRAVVSALQAVSGTLVERLRKAIAAAATRGQEVPQSYEAWCQLFDTWPNERIAAMRDALPGNPTVAAVVFGAPDTPALASTMASLADQAFQLSSIKLISPGSTDTAMPSGDWVAVLQAGEVLPRHALLLLLDEAARETSRDILFADEDTLLPDGRRSSPVFKPQASLTMMCSGLLSRGVWLIRPTLLQNGAAWAECARLQAWFGLHARGRAQAAWRVPFLLTHRRSDAEAAPPEVLAGIVNTYLRSAGVQAIAEAGVPLRLRWHADALVLRKISIVVPSRLRGRTQLACLAEVLAGTHHPNFELLVVVSQDGDLDDEQMRAARELCADRRVRVKTLRRAKFNYSAANNFGVRHTDGDFILLLNDDVAPIEPGWLERMVAMFSDPQVGIVGAKLYYPNMTVQHGGAIMGLAGLVEHANRFLPRGEPGYAWRGVLDQELSCVTGACMLVRRSLYDALDGLDEALPTGFNDVDFCLRLREIGRSVVFAAGVELIHHETITYGRHYADDRSQEAADVRLMQERWQEVCRNDPFHNPNLSLLAEAEWTLAFPPRVGTKW